MDMQSPMWSVWQVGTQSLSKLDLVGTLLVRGTGLCSSISSNRAADGGPLGALGLPDSNIVLRPKDVSGDVKDEHGASFATLAWQMDKLDLMLGLNIRYFEGQVATLLAYYKVKGDYRKRGEVRDDFPSKAR
ncbi:MAG: hypothetical protein Q9175_003321 [Cornicularia normoerica]